MKNYDEATIIREMKRRSGINITSKNEICISVNSNIGIHTWGKIDYLLNYCGYTIHKSEIKDNSAPIDEKEEKVAKRFEKRSKINMAKMTKNVMKAKNDNDDDNSSLTLFLNRKKNNIIKNHK